MMVWQIRRINYLVGIFSIILVFGLVFFGCDNESTSTPSQPHNNDAGDFAGTWQGLVMGYTATVQISNSGWTINVPLVPFTDTGSFNRIDNTATLYSSTNGKNVGTATATSHSSIQIVLNGNSAAPGSYTMTRQ